MSKKKIILWVAGILIAIPLLAIGIFVLVLIYGSDTPKDNDVIERSLHPNTIK